MDVGVRELKQHLSDYLERAAKGETIRVTDRGEPKVLIVPLPGKGRLAEGVAQGWIRQAEMDPPAEVRAAPAARRIADVLAEDRDE